MPASFRTPQLPPAPPPPRRRFECEGDIDDITIQVSTLTSPVISCTDVTASSHKNSFISSRNSSLAAHSESFNLPPATQRSRTKRTPKQLYKIILKQIHKTADSQLRMRSWVRLRLFVSQSRLNKLKEANKRHRQQPTNGSRESSGSGGLQLGRVGLMSLRESSESTDRHYSPLDKGACSPVTFSRLSSMSPLSQLSDEGIPMEAFVRCLSPSPPDMKLVVGCHFITDKSISNRGRWTRHFLTISDISPTDSCSFIQLHSKQLSFNTIHSYLSQSLMRFCGILTKAEQRDWEQNWWQREMEAEEQASPPRYLKL